ncbi:DUF4835 family protein [Rurimicrobium arvi]|uniref:DUF4835 family protein n=1 Tax=Rurimicrobium arvi TaxID=2049916 RepID=A0ABP8MP03_9BACT
MRLSYSILFLLLASLCTNLADAQEMNCKVSIRHDRITNVDAQVFVDMERAIATFINTRKWTNDDYTVQEKIDCIIMFNLTSKLTDIEGGYEATMNIQATRPVFNTGFNTSIINYIDREANFKFNQFSPLVFDDNRVGSSGDGITDNLSCIVAYYIYLVLGLDYDSFSMNGGNMYFKKAQNIVNNAPEGKGVRGWKAVDGTKNRYWLADQLLNPRFAEFHKYWYTMHRLGYDQFYDKPNEARKNILSGISTMQKMNRDNPNAILVQFFFNAKSSEFLNILGDMPSADRLPYITQLSQADVTNAQKYQALAH